MVLVKVLELKIFVEPWLNHGGTGGTSGNVITFPPYILSKSHKKIVIASYQ